MKMKIEIDFKSLKIGSFLKDFVATYQKAIYRGFRFLIKHWIKSLIVLLVFVLLALLVNFTAAFFWSLFLAFLIMHLDSRVFIAAALMCLLACPFLLVFKYQLWAEQLAIWAYYFLALGVILQIIEFIREPEEEEKPQEVPVKITEEIPKEGIFFVEHKKQMAASPIYKFILLLLIIVLGTTILTSGGIFLVRKYVLEPSLKNLSPSYNLKPEEKESKPPGQEIDKSTITITVLNGNGLLGAADKMKKELENQGFKVSFIGDASRMDYPETIIRYQPGSRKKAEMIAEVLKGAYTTKLEETQVSQETEIVIIVGMK